MFTHCGGPKRGEERGYKRQERPSRWVYRHCTAEVTPALEKAIDRIAREVEGFHFGRFDIRSNALRELQAGRNFAIVELNGAGTEMLHLWDGRTSLIKAHRIL